MMILKRTGYNFGGRSGSTIDQHDNWGVPQGISLPAHLKHLSLVGKSTAYCNHRATVEKLASNIDSRTQKPSRIVP